MRPPIRVRRWLRLAAAAGVWAWAAAPCRADGVAPVCPQCHRPHQGPHQGPHKFPGAGTLGYGKPGLYPGFQGFGMGYHLGYGYGGDALGPGAEGGYPFYGGPGYPHPAPPFRRFVKIVPFAHDGGPGGPTPGHPNFFGGVGPLAPDQPVVTVEGGPPDLGYGGFTGTVPYPETMFAPFVTIAAAAGSAGGVSSASAPDAPPNTEPAPGEVLDEHAAVRSLGVDAGPFDEPGRGRGLKVTSVYAGGAAERAGVRVGDVILSVNGYLTELPGHLTWVIANAAPDRVLKMSLRAASDGVQRTVTAKLP